MAGMEVQRPLWIAHSQEAAGKRMRGQTEPSVQGLTASLQVMKPLL